MQVHLAFWETQKYSIVKFKKIPFYLTLPCFYTLEFINVAGYFGLAGGVAPLVGWNWHLRNEFRILLTGFNNQF